MDSNLVVTVITPIIFMALFGVPHGALDAALIKMAITPDRRIFTFGGYIAIAILCIVAWYVLPTAAMLFFLALSAWHFGSSDIVDQPPPYPPLQIIARGGIWTLFLPLAHWSSTEPIFAQLQTDTELIKIGLILMLPLWVLGGITLLYTAMIAGQYKVVVTAALALVLVLLLPPLWSLGLYFCFWHARRHTQHALAQLSDTTKAKRLGRGITALTFGCAVAAFAMVPPEISIDTAMVRIFFIGIFALTVPHMILIDYYLPRTSPLGTHL